MADNLALPLLEVPPTSVVTDEGFVDEENERMPDLNFPPPDLSRRLIRDRDRSISGGGFPMGSTARYLVPYTMMVTAGENIVEKISWFLLMASGFVTILSAVGAISFADFYLPGSEIIRHEGCFQLLLLSGNFVCPPMRGVRSAECPLMVSLVDASGVVFGGAVAGYLIAACPVEINLLCFHGDH